MILKNVLKYMNNIPDSKLHGADMGPIWGRQDPGGPHVGLMNFAIWDMNCECLMNYCLSIANTYDRYIFFFFATVISPEEYFKVSVVAGGDLGRLR